MVGGFRSFVILAGMRTGSNLLESILNSVEGITSFGEAFNPDFVGKPGVEALFAHTVETREADPIGLLDRMRREPGLTGFRLFDGHDPRVLQHVLADPTCAKVVLSRNPVDSFLSYRIARQTDQWILTDLAGRIDGKAEFRPEEFEAFVESRSAFYRHVQRSLQATGQTGFLLDYEDLQDTGVLNGLLQWLGVDARLEEMPGRLKVQNPSLAADKVMNPATLMKTVSAMDPFALSRLPVFEARRGPAVPRFVAARGAQLLFQPVAGGPSGAVKGWLAGLGSGGTVEGFSRATLREWLKTTRDHTVFTVVSHPVLRAHRAFAAATEWDRTDPRAKRLRQAYKVGLAPLASLPVDDHRAAFLAFLRFLKGNVEGQTSLPQKPEWASQVALIEGFSQIVPPRVIAREGSLARDLAPLAPGHGMVESDDASARALRSIMSAEIDQAARQAYSRDYLAFGFGPYAA